MAHIELPGQECYIEVFVVQVCQYNIGQLSDKNLIICKLSHGNDIKQLVLREISCFQRCSILVIYTNNIDNQALLLPPFKWDEGRRAIQKAEQDAKF